MVVSTREEGLSGEHFGEDAAYGPDVDGFGVLFEGEHDFRGAVPLRASVSERVRGEWVLASEWGERLRSVRERGSG